MEGHSDLHDTDSPFKFRYEMSFIIWGSSCIGIQNAFGAHLVVYKTLPQSGAYWYGMTTAVKYQRMRTMLNEKQWRQYLATEAEERENVAVVAREARVSVNTIVRGRIEIAAGSVYVPGSRIRMKGAGPKRISDTDTTLVKDIESLVEPKGDPMSLVRWTTKSLSHLVEALGQKEHAIKKSALANLLRAQHFSLKANKKNIEGVSHPDRDLQFQYIKRLFKEFSG